MLNACFWLQTVSRLVLNFWFLSRLYVFNKFLSLLFLLLASVSGIMQAALFDTGFKACFWSKLWFECQCLSRLQGLRFTVFCDIFSCVYSSPLWQYSDFVIFIFRPAWKTVSLLLFSLFLSPQKAHICLECLLFSEKILAWKMMNKMPLFTSLLAFVFPLHTSKFSALLLCLLTAFDSFA